MNRISSVFTILYKMFLVVISMVIMFLGIIFLTKNNIVISVVILFISIIIFWLAKSLKSIYVNKNKVICKGFFSKKTYNKKEVIGVNSVFLFFYIKLANKKRVFFLNTVSDEIKALTKSMESVEADLFNKIK